jgi:hypothetical protein
MKHAITSLFAHRANALLACSAAVLLAACGGTDSMGNSTQTAAMVTTNADTGAATTSTTTSTAVSDVAPLSAESMAGDYAQETAAAAAVSAAPAEVNAAAGNGAAATAAPADGGTKLLAMITSVPPTNSAPAAVTPIDALVSAPASTSIYNTYVSTTGSDSNPGTSAKPFKTITKAASVAKPGTTVHVAAGTYYGNVSTRVSGTSSNRIRFVSDTKWGAKIVGSGSEAMWTNNGNYVDVVGFDITGPGRHGILNYASNTLMANNHVHNLTLSGGCTGNGGAGIVNATYTGSNGDIISNVIHDIAKPGQCNGVQGIYTSNKGGKIMNNIVYRVSSYGIHLWHAATDVLIANNTVFANGSSSMGGGIVVGDGDAPGGVQVKNTKVINNIVYKNPRGGIQQYCDSGSCIGTGNITANNLVYGNGTNISLRVGSATGTISADPKFVSYNPTGTGDYRLQSGSPAINKGTSASAPSTDILGAARPKGGAIDIGAYESY